MKQSAIILLSLSITLNASANVNFIDISKITNDSKLVSAFNLIKKNQEYYDHWTHEWNYDISKQELIKELTGNYYAFSSIPKKNEELYLLLGDIGFYLFNLDENSFSDTAIMNYQMAIKTSAKDFRPYWFLGIHYTCSNHSVDAIDNYLKAENLLPIDAPANFWDDYAAAAGIANMPSHCFYAMDKVKSITGMEGSFEAHLGQAIHNRMIEVNKDSSYSDGDMWSLIRGPIGTFISRPLGIKLFVDSTWKISVVSYANHKAAINMKPSGIKNKAGYEITYRIGILMKTANDTEKLETYVNSITSHFLGVNKISFTQKYDKMIAYEIRDKTMYQNVGGGHMYMIGIEREAPKYPGLLLETPASIPKTKLGERPTVYRAQGSKKRFDGRIFYLIMLDSCEDIHEQSYAIFKTFFDNQLIIE